MEQIVLGVNPRGSLALMRASQVYALLQGRSYVLPDDIKTLVKPVLGHRIIVKSTYGIKENQTEPVLEEIIASIPVPSEDLQFSES